MTKASLLDEPGRVEEQRAVQEYAEVLSKVAAAGRAVIVCRDGKELAAVIPLAHLELVREILARRAVDTLSAQIDWEREPETLRPPQAWFAARDNPFEPATPATCIMPTP